MCSASVNDHPTLTHEMILHAIRTNAPSDDLRQYADQAASVGAHALADELRDVAGERERFERQQDTDCPAYFVSHPLGQRTFSVVGPDGLIMAEALTLPYAERIVAALNRPADRRTL